MLINFENILAAFIPARLVCSWHEVQHAQLALYVSVCLSIFEVGCMLFGLVSVHTIPGLVILVSVCMHTIPGLSIAYVSRLST